MKKKRATAAAADQALANWTALNAVLRSTTDEAVVARLLEQEKAGENRLTFTLRIHARLSKLRRERERRALVGGTR